MGKLKLSIVVAPPEAVFEAVVKLELEKVAEMLVEKGFQGMEVSLLDPKPQVNRLLKIVRDYGLEIPALSTGLNYLHYGLSLTSLNEEIRIKAIKRLKDFIEVASKLNAGVVIGLIRGRADKDKELAYKLLIKGLKEACKNAEKSEVKLLLEPINRYETNLINNVDEALKVLRDINSPSLKLLLDTFHMNIEEPLIEESIKKAGKKIGHFHVADSNRLAPGMGHLDFKSIIGSLKETGYEGFLSAEVIIKPSLGVVLEYTKKTLGHLL